MRIKYLIILLIAVCSANLFGQNVQINEDFRVSEMVNRHIQANKSKASIEGWRIQILSTSDRAKADLEKGKFKANYPEFPVDWIHVKPNYKLRAGAFATKLDALEALNRIKKVFPSAYTAKVRDMNPREIVGW